MQLTYAGTVIAQEPDFGGFDAIEGFELYGDPIIQWGPVTRGNYQTPFPRDNRKLELEGSITSVTDSLAERMLLLESVFGNLPAQGDLVKQVGTQILTYTAAVLGPYRPLKDKNGVIYGYTLTFALGGPPTPSTA